MQPEPAPGLPAPAAARLQIGTYLRDQRVKRSLDMARAAAHAGIAPSTLSRIETGYAAIRTAYLYVLLDLYGITNDTRRRHLADLARQGQCQSYWNLHDDLIPEGTAQYLALEASATLIRIYAPLLIPDQLMTPAYAAVAARATRPDLRRPRDAGFARLAQSRHGQLARNGCRVHALIESTALHRLTSPAGIVAAQIRHLASLTNPAITVQVITSQPPAPVISPAFTLLTLSGQPRPVGCCHGPAGQVTITRRTAATRAMNATWEALTVTALTPAESTALLAESGQPDMP